MERCTAPLLLHPRGDFPGGGRQKFGGSKCVCVVSAGRVSFFYNFFDIFLLKYKNNSGHGGGHSQVESRRCVAGWLDAAAEV